MGLKVLGDWVIVGVLDHDTHTEVAPDGTRVEYHIDRATGLAMAPQVRPHVGIVMQAGPRTGLGGLVGHQVVVQRDRGREFDLEAGLRVKAFQAVEPCRVCGRMMPADVIAAVKVGDWMAGPGRVLVHPDPDEPGQGVVVRTDVRVVFRTDLPGFMAWADGGKRYVSLLRDRTCSCGVTRVGGLLGVVEGYQKPESPIVGRWYDELPREV